MTVVKPESMMEKWDAIAEDVRKARGKWVMVMETPANYRSQNQKVKVALLRRGIKAEVHSRLGDESEERPYSGWRTWARQAAAAPGP